MLEKVHLRPAARHGKVAAGLSGSSQQSEETRFGPDCDVACCKDKGRRIGARTPRRTQGLLLAATPK